MMKQKILTLLSSIGLKGKYLSFLVPLCLIAGSFVVGLVVEKTTKLIDSPVEQMAEKVLSNHGIDFDFSEHKKNRKKG